MDKFFHSTFDFFSHAIPGACVAYGFFLLDDDIQTGYDFVQTAGKMSLGATAALFLLGYLLGFAMYPVGRQLNRRIGLRIWKSKLVGNVDLFISDKYILIRELSPANFKYVETWNMFGAMAQNLTLAFLLLAGIALVKLCCFEAQHPWFWTLFAAAAVGMAGLFLHRSTVFFNWAADDLNAAITRLRLIERAAELQGKNSEK